MTQSGSETDRPASDVQRFRTTRWSVVLAAGGTPSPAAAAAIETLCRAYWPPLYAYLRRRGHDVHDAQDLTQGFFARLLEKGDLRLPDPARGRFRSFLLAAVRHFEANEWDRARAEKRGGGRTALTLDLVGAEQEYQLHPAHEETAEKDFERRWALAVLDRALTRLREDLAQGGKTRHFDVLKPFLAGDPGVGTYAEAAAALGVTENAIKVTVHRLRARFRDFLRAEIADTVGSPDEVDDEIRALFAAIP